MSSQMPQMHLNHMSPQQQKIRLYNTMSTMGIIIMSVSGFLFILSLFFTTAMSLKLSSLLHYGTAYAENYLSDLTDYMKFFTWQDFAPFTAIIAILTAIGLCMFLHAKIQLVDLKDEEYKSILTQYQAPYSSSLPTPTQSSYGQAAAQPSPIESTQQ